MSRFEDVYGVKPEAVAGALIHAGTTAATSVNIGMSGRVGT